MKSVPATFLAATVLLGSMAVTSVAQELPRDVSQSEYNEYEAWDNGKATNQPASAHVDDAMDLSDDGRGAQSANPEVNELRGQVDALRSLCAHMYEDVHNHPANAQEIQFASMLERLETGNDCLSQPYVTPGAACDSACGETSCCTPCQPCCESTWYGGAALVFIRPHFHEDVAFITDPAPDDNHVQSFHRDFEPSARVWLGYTGCDGSGVRATFWHFDHDADSQSIVGTAANTPIFVQVIGAGTGIGRNAFADDGETFIAQHSLILQTLDLEATKQYGRCRSYVNAGLGLRYAKMEQEFNARVFDANGALDEQVVHRHDFEGFGPTVSLFFHQQFGQSNWGGYGNLRGSILFGDRNQSIHEVKNGGANVGQDFFDSSEVMTIGEIGLGIQYSRSINCDRSLVFVRAGYEGQVWFDAGGPLSTTGDLGLEGLVLSFGIEG